MIDKHIAIFGATSGIGLAFLKSVKGHNRVSAFGRRSHLLSDLTAANNEVFGFQCDVSDKSVVLSKTLEAVALNGKLDLVLYAAGIQILKPHRMMEQDDFIKSFASNLGGMLNVSSVFCSSKVSNKNAVFGAISSVAASKTESGLMTYSAEKSGIQTLIKGLAKEAAPRRFFGISPGFLDTDMTRSKSFYTDSVISEIEKQSPLGLISIEDVVDAIIFMMGDNAKKITGQTLVVDAGFSL